MTNKDFNTLTVENPIVPTVRNVFGSNKFNPIPLQLAQKAKTPCSFLGHHVGAFDLKGDQFRLRL